MAAFKDFGVLAVRGELVGQDFDQARGGDFTPRRFCCAKGRDDKVALSNSN
ncbi:hypothetical protein [Sandarakinorhabdus sp. DWP1-3-1]|uniref:hypothetical protein n=1 Tax=Sandarakinorhabdus sp. DWP1-3-1 TaxID=2804627 RepID=UPI003CEFBC87